jgi:hypothetical protein
VLQLRLRTGRVWVSLLLLAALVWGLWPTIAVAQAAILRIRPERLQADPGSDVLMEVVIENVENLGFFQFDLTFDPAVVQVKAAELGEFLGSTGRSASGVGPIIDNEQGKLTFGGFTYGAEPGPNGAGVLAQVTLTGVDDGTSTLTMANITVRSTENVGASALSPSPAIVVIGVGGPTALPATPTPLPDATPTAASSVAPPSAATETLAPSTATPGATPSGQTPAPQTTTTAAAAPSQATPTSGLATTPGPRPRCRQQQRTRPRLHSPLGRWSRRQPRRRRRHQALRALWQQLHRPPRS